MVVSTYGSTASQARLHAAAGGYIINRSTWGTKLSFLQKAVFYRSNPEAKPVLLSSGTVFLRLSKTPWLFASLPTEPADCQLHRMRNMLVSILKPVKKQTRLWGLTFHSNFVLSLLNYRCGCNLLRDSIKPKGVLAQWHKNERKQNVPVTF